MDNPQDFNLTQQMMKEPFQYLDTVLEYLAMDKETTIKLSANSIWNGLKTKPRGFDISEGTLRLILDKLVRDGNIFFVQHNLKVYKITFEGLLFHKSGGYKNKLMLDNFKKSQEENNQKLQTRMAWFTGIVAFGTAIAAFYYIIEIYKICKS